MILPDVNVLVYAFRREASRHERYAAWLAAVVSGDDELALHDSSLSGFVRIVTNPRVVSTPAPTQLALDFVTRLRAARRSRWLSAGNLSLGPPGAARPGGSGYRRNPRPLTPILLPWPLFTAVG